MNKIMRLLAAVIFTVLAICACEKNGTGEGEKTGFPEITLEENVLNAGEDGGVFEVGYTLSHTLEGGSIVVNSPVDWITMTDNDGSVTVTVAANPVKEARDTSVTVEYWMEDSFVADSIHVFQDALSYDYKLNASEAVCEYYGDMLDRPGSPHNYYLMVSDLGWDMGNAIVYRFDIYLPTPDDASRLSLPEGEYLLGEVLEPMKFSRQYSAYSVNNQSATEYVSVVLTEGRLTVERQGSDYVLDAVLTDANGETHHMMYTGPIDFKDYYEPAPEVSSILTEDFTADLSKARLYADYYGDEYGYGTYIWYLHIRNEEWTGDAFIIELCSPNDDFEGGIPENNYAVSPSGDEFTVIQGYYAYPVECGSWLYQYDEEAAETKVSPLNSGVISVTHNDDGTSTVTIGCMDDNLDDPHKITGSWTGVIIYNDGTSMAPADRVRSRR